MTIPRLRRKLGQNFPSPTVQFDTTTAASMKTSLKIQIDSASFPTISRLSQVAQLLKRREFMLELKRGGRAQVQTEMLEFIALPFPPSKKLKMLSFHLVVVQGRQKKCTNNRDARVELLFC